MITRAEVEDVISTKLKSMSDDDIRATWEALRKYDSSILWDAERGITMDEWANAVYMEKDRRKL